MARVESAVWLRSCATAVAAPELLGRIDERLRRLEQHVAATAPSPAPRTAAPTREAAAGPPGISDAIAARLDRLEQLLHTAAYGGPRPLPRSLPANHVELAALHALDVRDRDTARRSTMLLTPTEVATRFGFPDEVGGTDGGVYWSYHHHAADGSRAGGTLFVFCDGHVAWHEIRVPD